MSFSQLFKRLLEWVQRLLSSVEEKAPQPFISIREKQYPLGRLKLVEGRDTMHAVRTWIVSPNPSPHILVPMDLHIYLDFIDVTSEERPSRHEREGPRLTTTHAITLMWASHALQEDGHYTYEPIFSKQYDFKGQHATSADVQARIACDRIAVLAGMTPMEDIEWVEEIEEIYQHVMGREGIPSTHAFKFWRKKKQSARKVPRYLTARSPAVPRTPTPRYSLNHAHMGKTTKR